MCCNCYVSRLPREQAFAIRYGAHEETCPKYRVSRDPVDAAADAELRQRYTAPAVAPRVVIVLEGGLVQAVYCDQGSDVSVLDLDQPEIEDEEMDDWRAAVIRHNEIMADYVAGRIQHMY